MKNFENFVGKRAITAPSGVPDEDVPSAAVSAVAKPVGGKVVAGKANGGKANGGNGGKGRPAAGKPAPPVKAGKPLPVKTTPGPNKGAWRKPGGFAPQTVHGSVRR